MTKGAIMERKAIQDYYPEVFAHCYCCGRLNHGGIQIKSYWDGNESICHYMPAPQFTGGCTEYLYGGIITSVIDCHGVATATAAKLKSLGYSLDEHPLPRFVCASIKVDFIKPTPMGKKMQLNGRITEMKDRKITVSVVLTVESVICAKGEAVYVKK